MVVPFLVRFPTHILKMASSEALKRIEGRATAAEELITVLRRQIDEIKAVTKTINYDEEMAKLKQENAGLKSEIQSWKGRLVSAETTNGVPQVAFNQGPNKPSAEALPSATEAPIQDPPQKSDDKKTGKKKPENKKSEAGSEKPTSVEAAVHIGRLDMRVGLIRSATKHPDADALYVEEVDVGEEKPRTVISGLVKFIPLEEMQNRKAVILCNLKPSKMRGILSEAMVMCASTPDKVEILSPPDNSKPGDPVMVEGFARNPDPQLNPKKKIFEACAPDLKVDEDKVATYRGVAWTVNGEKCHAQTLSNVQIK